MQHLFAGLKFMPTKGLCLQQYLCYVQTMPSDGEVACKTARAKERVKRKIVCMRNLLCVPRCRGESNVVLLGTRVWCFFFETYDQLRSLRSRYENCVPTTCVFDKCASIYALCSHRFLLEMTLCPTPLHK
jgi:hypothetical protein